ncbi:MAG: acyl-CoA/acyl-ACP dehydrogenase [Deltaproteobacteria bacterium]|nr:acyl-CoA/acyl-ACP dehydrogenase [Deltaproteobacteria bacterium]
MDLHFTEEQRMLRDTVRSLCAEQSPIEIVRRMEDDPIGFPAAFWKQLGELGVTGLTVPEAHGGGGQSVLEAMIVYEELGRALAPSPHFVSAVLCGGVIARAGTEAQKRAWLPQIASGEAILTPAWLEPRGGYGPAGVRLATTGSGGDVRLSGAKRHVLFAKAATRLLVLARSGAGADDVELYLVDPTAPGVTLTQQHTVASDTQYEVVFRDVPVAGSERVGAARGGWSVWNDVMHEGIVLLAAQAMGGAERALEITVDFAKTRHQFDKPLGAFQAIAHYLADAATTVDGGRTLVHEAAWALATGRPVAKLAPMAKLFACRTYRDVTAMAQQVHGGIGFTTEYDIQLFFRRAKQLQLSFWDDRYLEELVAAAALAGRSVAPG